MMNFFSQKVIKQVSIGLFILALVAPIHVLVVHAQVTATDGTVGPYALPNTPTATQTTYGPVNPSPYGGGTSSGITVRSIVSGFGSILNNDVLPILVVLAVVYFLVNIIYFISHMNNVADRDRFRKYTINSIIALFVILSVWGIVSIGTRTLFGVNPVVPQFKTSDH